MFNFKYHSHYFGAAKKGKFPASFLSKFILILLISFNSYGQPGRIVGVNLAGNIEIELSDLRSSAGGKIVACLFKKEMGFPDDGSKAFQIANPGIANAFVFKEIPKGEYALALLHDLDGDGKMTYSMLGMPKDGFASSPDGGPLLSKPTFKAARFFHDGIKTRLKIKMHYLSFSNP
jgi:uncharacterized protein (DUF2141 family)